MCFGRTFHLILMHFYILHSMLWGKFSKIKLFSLKSCFFQNFDWSNLIFDQSKSCLKKFSEPLPGSIDRTCFSINRRSCFKFLKKTVFWLTQTLFQNFFQTFLSLSDLARLHRRFFVFYLIFARFFSHKAGKTFIPLLLFLFSCFHALSHAL